MIITTAVETLGQGWVARMPRQLHLRQGQQPRQRRVQLRLRQPLAPELQPLAAKQVMLAQLLCHCRLHRPPLLSALGAQAALMGCRSTHCPFPQAARLLSQQVLHSPLLAAALRARARMTRALH